MVWARRQLQADLAAGMAHHHIGQEITQQGAVAGQARVAAGHELLAELLGAFELARLEHCDQVVQLG